MSCLSCCYRRKSGLQPILAVHSCHSNKAARQRRPYPMRGVLDESSPHHLFVHKALHDHRPRICDLPLRFVLKGDIFLYAIFDRKYERATTDVDLLARRISNSAEEMRTVFRDILKKKRALIPVSMNDATFRIRTFVTPLLTQPSVPVTEWDPNEGCWK